MAARSQFSRVTFRVTLDPEKRLRMEKDRKSQRQLETCQLEAKAALKL
jgi:hypothetical protein